MQRTDGRRVRIALVCLFALFGSFISGAVPVPALADAAVTFNDPQSQRAMALLDGQSCASRFAPSAGASTAQATPAASPAASSDAVPAASPSPTASPTLPPPPSQPGQLYATPFPRGTQVTPPPVPTATPAGNGTPGPVFLTRGSAAPSIAPAGPGGESASPSPAPRAVPTLAPGHIAVLADKVVGGTKPGMPADATGNVHIFYRDEVLVGDRAHFDGVRTITVSGHPYILNNAKNSILYADSITFDTLAQKARLVNGRGESSQGVQKGLVYYSAHDLKSDEHGVAHGDNAYVTTCERPRAGYHITGRTVDVIPGNRIVITKAVLWLGAAAIFFLPRVVIPLRSVQQVQQRPQYFPEVGYNSYQGYYIRATIGFGKNQYYYGAYHINFYSREGLELGYDGTITKKDGKRQTIVHYDTIHDRRQQQTTTNFDAQDMENFSNRLRGQFELSYNSNFGPLISLPPNSGERAQVVHTGSAQDTQSYSFVRSTTGSQSSNSALAFSDQRSFAPEVQNSLAISSTRSQSNYGAFSSNATGTFDDQLHWSNKVADYMLSYDKTYAQQPFGINKEPELQIRPYALLPHFIFPISSSLTIGDYTEQQQQQAPVSTLRSDLNVIAGPALYHVLGSDFSANLNVHQFAYGTGDLKASINQNATLQTAIGTHIANNITYNETNYNGPALVPFYTLDQQPTTNYKTAADVLRFFNGDYYNLSLDFATSFNRMAQSVGYQLALRPTAASYLNLTGAFTPGPGNGFYSTNFQLATPVGIGGFVQFIGDVNWKERARIENKTIYYSRIIGDCYEVQVQFSQAARQLNVSLNLLAFPSYGANFGLSTQGSVVPSSINGSF